MIEWGKVPWSLWLYLAISVGQTIVVAFTASTHVGLLMFFIVFIGIWDFFLLKAVRWLWVGTVALGALTIAANLATGTGTWHGDLIGAVGIGLLLLPATRRFFVVGEPAAAT